jgi:hypothetical protein
MKGGMGGCEGGEGGEGGDGNGDGGDGDGGDGGDGGVNMQMHWMDEEHEPELPAPKRERKYGCHRS